MRLAKSACFPSCTKTDGMETAPHMTPKQSAAGVQLKPNISMNSKDTAQLLVSLQALAIAKLCWKCLYMENNVLLTKYDSSG